MEYALGDITASAEFEYLLRGEPGRSGNPGNVIVAAYKSGTLEDADIEREAGRLRPFLEDGDCWLLPVPASSSESYERGGRDFAHRVCEMLPGLHDASGLVEYRYDRLPSHASGYRGKYCLDHVSINGDLTGRRFVLFDDVVTTGNTMSLLSGMIKDRGGTVCGCLAMSKAALYVEKLKNDKYMSDFKIKTDEELRSEFSRNVQTGQKYVDLGGVSEDMFRSGFCAGAMDFGKDFFVSAKRADVYSVLRKIGSDEDLLRDALSHPLMSWTDGYKDSRINMLLRIDVPGQPASSYVHFRAERDPREGGRIQFADRFDLISKKKAARLVAENWLPGKVTFANMPLLSGSDMWPYVPEHVRLSNIRSNEPAEAELNHLAWSFSRTFNLPDNVRIINTTDEMQAVLGKVSPACVGRYDSSTDQVFLNREAILNSSAVDKIEYASRVLMHECCGHYGLRRLLGRRFEGIMQKIYDNPGKILGPELRSRERMLMEARDLKGKPLHSPSLYSNPNAPGKIIPSAEWKTLVAEEFLSYSLENRPSYLREIRENKPYSSFCRKFHTFLLELRLHVPFRTVTPADVDVLLSMSVKKVLNQHHVADRLPDNPFTGWIHNMFDNHTHTTATRQMEASGQLERKPSFLGRLGRIPGGVYDFMVEHNRLRWAAGIGALCACSAIPSVSLYLTVHSALLLTGAAFETFRLGVNAKNFLTAGKNKAQESEYPGGKYKNSVAMESSAAKERATDLSGFSSVAQDSMQFQSQEFREFFGSQPGTGTDGSLVCQSSPAQPAPCYVRGTMTDVSLALDSACSDGDVSQLPRFCFDSSFTPDQTSAAARAAGGDTETKCFLNVRNPYFMTDLTRKGSVSMADNPMVLLCNLSREFPDVAKRMEFYDGKGNPVDISDFDRRFQQLRNDILVRRSETDGVSSAAAIACEEVIEIPVDISVFKQRIGDYVLATYPSTMTDMEIRTDAALKQLQAETGIVLEKTSDEYLCTAPGLLEAIRETGADGILFTSSGERNAEISPFSPAQVKEAGVLEHETVIESSDGRTYALDCLCRPRDVTSMAEMLKNEGVDIHSKDCAKALAYSAPFTAPASGGRTLRCIPHKDAAGRSAVKMVDITNHPSSMLKDNSVEL